MSRSSSLSSVMLYNFWFTWICGDLNRNFFFWITEGCERDLFTKNVGLILLKVLMRINLQYLICRRIGKVRPDLTHSGNTFRYFCRHSRKHNNIHKMCNWQSQLISLFIYTKNVLLFHRRIGTVTFFVYIKFDVDN